MGTSATKAVLIDETGAVRARHSVPYPLSTPRPGWAEQDPEDWVRAAEECLETVGEAAAVAFTGQMHGAVLVGADGRALGPALLWCDQRTGAQCRELERLAGRERLLAVTKNAVSPGLQAPKLLWLREHRPEQFAAAKTALLPKDYVQARITGIVATEATDASGVGLFDVAARGWDVGLMESAGLDPGWFPRCAEPGERLGEWRGAVVAAGAGDQAAGAAGSGAAGPGSACVSLGTSGVALRASAEPPSSAHPSLNQFCHVDRGWLTMGVMLSCGGAVAWARERFFPGLGFAELSQAAAEAGEDDGGPVFLPYLSGERCPVVAPGATGALLGLRASDSHASLARAVFEGVTLGLADCAELAFGGERPDFVSLTGGGAASPYWCQLVADFLGLECRVLESEEGPAFGAALLAGAGLGVWSTAAEAAQETVRPKRAFEPSGRDLSALRARFEGLRSLGLGTALGPDAIQSS